MPRKNLQLAAFDVWRLTVSTTLASIAAEVTAAVPQQSAQGDAMLGRTIKIFAALALCSLPTVASSADESDRVTTRLVFYITTVSVAIACGEPASIGPQAAELIWKRLNEQQPKLAARISKGLVSKQILDGVENDERILKKSQGRYFDKPCSFYRAMASEIVESHGEVVSFADEDASPSKPQVRDDEEPSKEWLRKQLEDVSAKLPKGALKAVVGCWAATTPNWGMQACFTDGGDSVNVKITSNKGVTCQLTNGTARKRSDAVFFYAFAEPPACSDNSPIEHVEALCEPGNREMTCIFSFFSRSNYMFSLRNQEPTADINGQLRLVRR